jgi:hypothetical protein
LFPSGRNWFFGEQAAPCFSSFTRFIIRVGRKIRGFL